MCCRCCSETQQKLWVFGVGLLLLTFGLLCTLWWPSYAEDMIYKTLPLKNGGRTYDKWSVTPIPVYLHMYLFNWTNPDQVRVKGVKPHFDRVGPYVFREDKVKRNVTFYPNNTVSFEPQRTWYFEPEMSGGTLEDVVTCPHLPSITASKLVRSMHPIVRKIANFAVNREGGKLAMTNSAIDWIFHGIYDDFMDFAERLHSPLLGVTQNHFAYFYNRNNTKETEGTFTINTGQGDLSQLGNVKYWNGLEYSGYWKGECGRINGTTAEIWSPDIKWQDQVSIFFSDAARFINIYPQNNETYRGVNVRRYTSTELTFDSGYFTEDTKCFCVRDRQCPKNGVIDYSPVFYRAPLYISHPHFYMADPLYRENTTGLNPDPEKHSFYILLEPKMGIPMDIKGQVLLSALLERDEKFDLYKDLAWNFYAPMLTLQICAEIDDDLLRILKIILNLPHIGQYCGIVFTCIGLIMICTGIYLTKSHKWYKENYSET